MTNNEYVFLLRKINIWEMSFLARRFMWLQSVRENKQYDSG